jgi:hypothetical protein
MSPVHAVKQSRRYRYYSLQTDGEASCDAPVWLLGAHDIEARVAAQLADMIERGGVRKIGEGSLTAGAVEHLRSSVTRTVEQLRSSTGSDLRAAILQLVRRTDVTETGVFHCRRPRTARSGVRSR